MASNPLGGYTLGVELLGGDHDDDGDPTVATTVLLGDTPLGWGMLGGDGDTAGVVAPPAESDLLGTTPLGWGLLGGDGYEPAPSTGLRLSGAIGAGSKVLGHLRGLGQRLATGPLEGGTSLEGRLRGTSYRLPAVQLEAGTRLVGRLTEIDSHLHTTPLRAGSKLAYVSLHQVTTQIRTYVLLGTAAAESGIRQPSVIDREPVTARPPSLGW